MVTTIEGARNTDYLALFLPVPVIVFLFAILVEIDNRRTLSNYELQEELRDIRNMYDVRKTTEETFDGI
jgi:hypothetical protein